jgi:hypothetical protein
MVVSVMEHYYNRFDKLNYLIETCASYFVTDCDLLRELVSRMSEDDFNEFIGQICRLYNIDAPWYIQDEDEEHDEEEQDEEEE